MSESVEAAVRESIGFAAWLLECDKGAVQLALRIAAQVDQALDSGDAMLAVTFSKALKDILVSLGLTPSGRTGKAEPKAEVNPLDALRAKVNG